MTAAIVSVLTDRSLNDSVIFGYTLQTAHAVFLPFPANANTVSQPVKERNIESGLDFAAPNAWLIS